MTDWMRDHAKSVLALAGATALLAGCMLLPGKFTSNLAVERDGRFAFTYKGEIQLLGMQAMLKKAAEAEKAKVFTPGVCHDFGASDVSADAPEPTENASSDSGMKERPCTKDELKEQKTAWEASRASKSQEDAQMSGMMGRMLGGLNPDDPKSIDRFAKNLERIAGWNAVRHTGDGVFEVDYATTGTLDRDFVFPLIPGYVQASPIVHLQRWKDSRVKLTTPALADGGSNGLLSLLGAMPFGPGKDKDMPKFKPVDGDFSVSTDAEIVTNNTDEGPETVAGRKILRWKIDAENVKAPETLLRLTPRS